MAAFVLAGRRQAREAIAWTAVVFASILVHELGHALVARRLGYHAWIELHALGGRTHRLILPTTPAATWRGELAVALAGPLAGFLLGAATFALSRGVAIDRASFAAQLVHDMLWVNVGWGIINLVPILPYDGGLACAAVASRVWPTRAWIPHALTVIVGGAACVWTIWTRNYWLTFLAGQGVYASVIAWRSLAAESRLNAAWADWDCGNLDSARTRAAAYIARGPNDASRANARELLILVELRAMRPAEAKALYDAYPETEVPSPLLRALKALDKGDDDEAARLLDDIAPAWLERALVPILIAWARGDFHDRVREWISPQIAAALPVHVLQNIGAQLFFSGSYDLSAHVHEVAFAVLKTHDAAYNVACSKAKLGLTDEAMAWLTRAVEGGFADLDHLDRDHDFDSLVDQPAFQALRQRLQKAAPF
jgi:Zn-dependent protease